MSDIKSRFHHHSDGSVTVHRWQDAEPIIEHNKQLQSIPQTRSDGLKHIASIPTIVFEQWVKETNGELMRMPSHEQQKFFRRKLRDPANRYLLTTGRL